MILKQGNALMVINVIDQHPFDFHAGHILGMDNSFLRVSALTSEIEVQRLVTGCVFSFNIETSTEIDQFADSIRSVFNNHLHNIPVAETVSGGKRVLDMKIKRIELVEDRGNAPLGQSGAGVHDPSFGDQGNRTEFRHFQGKGQTGNATADDKEVCFKVHYEFI